MRVGGMGFTRRAQRRPAGIIERAVKSGRAALIELRTDPELITTRTTITAIREGALAKIKEGVKA